MITSESNSFSSLLAYTFHSHRTFAHTFGTEWKKAQNERREKKNTKSDRTDNENDTDNDDDGYGDE